MTNNYRLFVCSVWRHVVIDMAGVHNNGTPHGTYRIKANNYSYDDLPKWGGCLGEFASLEAAKAAGIEQMTYSTERKLFGLGAAVVEAEESAKGYYKPLWAVQRPYALQDYSSVPGCDHWDFLYGPVSEVDQGPCPQHLHAPTRLDTIREVLALYPEEPGEDEDCLVAYHRGYQAAMRVIATKGYGADKPPAPYKNQALASAWVAGARAA